MSTKAEPRPQCPRCGLTIGKRAYTFYVDQVAKYHLACAAWHFQEQRDAAIAEVERLGGNWPPECVDVIEGFCGKIDAAVEQAERVHLGKGGH